MGFGTNIMKTLMFIFNGIVWVLGLVLLVVGIVVLVEGRNWNDIIDGKTVPISVMLIVVGLVIAVVGFLGCCGAMKQNGCMLLAYAIALGIIIIVQLVAGILAFVYSDEAKELVETGLEKGIEDYGIPDNSVKGDSVWTRGVDWMQIELTCCGITNSYDWTRLANTATWWIAVSGGDHINDTPDSCCKLPADGCGNNHATGYSKYINDKGCLDQGIKRIKSHSKIMGLCGIIFLVVELFSICCAIYLMKHS